jgi:heptosyltransferase-2
MRILILRGGALGDFIVTLPAIGLLRSRWPAAHIALIGNIRAAALATGGPCLAAAYDQNEVRWAPLFSSDPLPGELADFLRSFDLVLNFWPDPDGALAAQFAQLGFGDDNTRRFLSASAQPALAPAARHFCSPLRELGLTTNDFRSRLPLTGQTTVTREAPIALHAGSGSPRKNWPVDLWLELGRRLHRDHGAPLLFCGGEADEALRAPLAEGLAGIPHTFAWNLPLRTLAGQLARCRLFVGHDSGVSHLAAATGTPCVLLFGPTDPAMWAPPGPHVTVIQRGPTLDEITVADVEAAVAERLQADLDNQR